MNDLVKELIQRAADKYPIGICYNGWLTEEQINEIELYCDVNRPSVYMNGSAMYEIRRRR